MRRVTRRAPAKLNLTLEVLERRPDGYHELRSVMTTISLCDTLSAFEGHGVVVSADESYDASALPSSPDDLNTVEMALALLAARRPNAAASRSAGRALQAGLGQVGLTLRKEIPAAAGLGGGSSDAAATLLALDEFWQMNFRDEDLLCAAAEIGSDCPFFVRGGVQLVEGRGDRLTPLPLPEPFWVCVLKPPLVLRRKTATLYSLLTEENFSDGSAGAQLARRLSDTPGCRLQASDLCNVFDVVADAAFGSLDQYRQALEQAGMTGVQLCGSGPALFGLAADERAARAAEVELRGRHFDAWAASSPAPS